MFYLFDLYKKQVAGFSLLALLVLPGACKKLLPAAPKEDQTLDGPVEGLTEAQRARHLAGDQLFNQKIFTAETGLGPVFVASSCGGCHAGDGKGHPFTTLTRFGQVDSSGNLFLSQGGPQLQNRALPGHVPEVVPPGASFAKFTPPANTGLGFLELVPDADLIAMSDPADANGDGISAVPNWKALPAYQQPFSAAVSQSGKYLHRFGKKAAAYSLLHQTVNAFNQDMGITSVFDPTDVSSLKTIDPEVATEDLHNVVFYLQTLKAPLQRNAGDAEVIRGRQLFKSTGCEACHRETLKTGYSPLSALSYQEFHPYTDLLLHDMGPGLDDGYTEGSAKTYEWRTAPLWGLGLSPNSQGGRYYLLHDGRAGSIEAAIQLHGGEGTASRNKFELLSAEDKTALVKFLKAL